MAAATLAAAVLDSEGDEKNSSTDELLSRLAGEEIDHLLAEAEEGRTKAPPAEAPRTVTPAAAAPGAADSAGAAPGSDAAEDSDLAAQLDAVLLGAEPAAESPADAPASDEAAAGDLASQLDAVLLGAEPGASELGRTAAAANKETIPSPAAPTQSEIAQAEQKAASAVASRDAEAAEGARLDNLAAELEVNSPTAMADEELGEHSFISPEEEVAAQPRDLPGILKPLLWINSPVLPYSDRIRAFIGWAAILTLINASGVLAYVAIFRKH